MILRVSELILNPAYIGTSLAVVWLGLHDFNAGAVVGGGFDPWSSN